MAKDLPVSVGDSAPNFTLPDQEGNTHTLASYKGKWVVLYFYPKALTPGCTLQAQAVRDNNTEFKALNAVVFGVSADEEAKLKKFADKHELPFTLLGDTDHNMLESYGMWQQKSMFGNKYMGVMRSTFIIDPQGKIAHIIPKASPTKHHTDVINWLKKNGHQSAA